MSSQYFVQAHCLTLRSLLEVALIICGGVGLVGFRKEHVLMHVIVSQLVMRFVYASIHALVIVKHNFSVWPKLSNLYVLRHVLWAGPLDHRSVMVQSGWVNCRLADCKLPIDTLSNYSDYQLSVFCYELTFLPFWMSFILFKRIIFWLFISCSRSETNFLAHQS